MLRYQVKYKETEQVIINTCKIFNLAQKRMRFRIFVAVGGVFVLAFMLYYGSWLDGTAGEILTFFLKYIIVWGIVFVAADILAQTVGKKLEEYSSQTDGEEMYEIRMRTRKEPPAVRIEFYDDHVVNIVGGKGREYKYPQVTRLLEMKDTLGIIMMRENGTKGLYGFPADGLVDADLEEFKAFLTEKCTGVKGGFTKL